MTASRSLADAAPRRPRAKVPEATHVIGRARMIDALTHDRDLFAEVIP